MPISSTSITNSGRQTTTENTSSSQRLVDFLESANLHKKDFAEMIGVTLSYVYSLIDQNISFSSRTTTLERVATLMELPPESFPEYKLPEEPRLIDPGIEFLKSVQRNQGLSNVQFLKRFPRTQRLEIVDMWRGALPMPLDWAKLFAIAQVLELGKEDIYPYWQSRFQQYLTSGGIEPMTNIGLLNAMFQGVKAYLRM
jgi:transcriptional regulator with XRE-family HTH domain